MHLSSAATPLGHFQRKWRMSYQRQELPTLRERLGSYLVFDRVGVAHLFSYLLCVVSLCFVCLRYVFCVSNVTSVSGLAILDCSFGIL